MHGVLAGLGLQSLLIGHDELAQTVHHLIEHVGGNDTIAQQFFSPLCPRGVIFSPPHIGLSIWDADWKRL